ncbi:MAG: PQQ-binding-like beta-propeller repeat protein [Acidobacteria bacterium]|nr:PQQ-binding-like beta-propeller repeat protein [Acidobacteriota bacterium]
MRVLIPLLLLTAVVRPQDWPHFRGNAQLTGVTSDGPAGNLKVLWTFETGDVVESSPAIADGTVYQGVGNGEVVALELATGKLKWRYKGGELAGESSPAAAGGVVYIGDLTGNVHAIDAADGKRLWIYKTGNLYGLDAKKGVLAWKAKTEGPVHATAAIADGLAFISGCDGMLRAIRISDGRQAYAIKSGAYTGASPALAGGFAYFGTFNNEVLAVDLGRKRIVWRYEHPQRNFPFYSTAAVAGGKVIVGGRDKMLHALDVKTGKEVWALTTRARIDSSPAVAGGRVYVGSNDNRFYVVELSSGGKVWEFDAGSPISSSPALAGGYVVIASQDGRVYCFGG